MTIRVVRKEPELPPARLYLEDIEEIVSVMTERAKEDSKGKEPVVGFVLGKRECDTIDDLKAIGGKWRNFRIDVGHSTFKTHYTSSYMVAPAEVFDHVLRLMNARKVKLRSMCRDIPWWVVALWFIGFDIVVNIVKTPSTVWPRVVMLSLFFGPLVLGLWAVSAHTIVELRYSHVLSPKAKVAAEWGSKAAWIILGVLLTSFGHWLWHYLTAR
jgi:hypothetical protein